MREASQEMRSAASEMQEAARSIQRSVVELRELKEQDDADDAV
jgi:hypothetical protein